jgi:hypothetical protein
MPEESPLHVLRAKRRLEQRVVAKVDLTDRQVVRRAPVGIDTVKELA